MVVLLQRVSEASVTVANKEVARIGQGLLVFFCAHRDDQEDQTIELAEKTLKLRIFADATKPMNRSIVDVQGEALVVPQFTLAADTRKGNRPSFHLAKDPATAEHLYLAYTDQLRQQIPVQTGVFGASMQVHLVNDGPVTLLLHPS